MKVESCKVWNLKKQAYNVIDIEDWEELYLIVSEIKRIQEEENK